MKAEKESRSLATSIIRAGDEHGTIEV